MKKAILLFLLSISIIIIPVITSAEIREGSVEINPYIGLHVFDTSTDFQKKGIYGLRLGYNITNHIGIEGAYDHTPDSAQMLHADLLYNFNPEKSLNPFFVAGIGGAHISPDGRDSYNTLMGNFGLGFKYFFTDNIAFRADVRDVITNMQNVVATAGLTFAFGGKIPKPAPEPPPPPPPPAPKPEPAPAPKPEPAPPPPPPPPAPEPVKIILEDIHFDFDKATLTHVAKQILDKNIKVIKENPGIMVQIEGHTCAHGTEEYNMALGERRANAVKEYFIKEGIAADRLTTISYGETRLAMPEIPTPKNKESIEARTNRRVHFEVIIK
ncbi:MAG: OmpA family protein [Nitrospirota bacterium]